MVNELFQTAYKRIRSTEKVEYPPSIVETSGFVSASQAVKNVVNAGQDLSAYRRGMYEFVIEFNQGQHEDPEALKSLLEMPMDVSRLRGFDRVDALKAFRELGRKAAASQAAQKKAFEESEAKKAEEAKKLEKQAIYDELRKEFSEPVRKKPAE